MRGLKDKPHGAAAPLTLGQLTKAKGLVRFAKALNASPEDMVRINSVAKKYIEDKPHLATLSIGKSTSGDFYDIRNNRIALSSSDPDIFSHELGHAARLGDSSSSYKKVLGVSRALNKILNSAAIPVSGALSFSPLVDQKHKSSILKSLAVATAVTALPNLAEEALASADAINKSTEKIKTLTNLVPGFGAHAIHDLGGSGAYALFSRLSKNTDKKGP